MIPQDTGYYYYPSKYTPPLGHPKLDVFLQSGPSQGLFNTLKAIFPVAEPDGFRELAITHPWEDWMGPEVVRVCAGRFQLFSHKGETHYGFSLGGELKIQNQGNFTLCSLTSSAPIFNLMRDDPKSMGELLTNEIEVLFAQRMASWGTDEAGFAKRLSEVEPFTLFVAVLATLEQEVQKMPTEAKQHGYQPILHVLREAIHTIKQAEEWPEVIPTISELI